MHTIANASVDLLGNVDMFSHLTGDQLHQLAGQTRELSFRKNAVLMNEGDAGESMYVLKSGSVKVYLSDEEGRQLVLYEQGPGTAIGDIALLDDAPRSASVMALEPCTALVIGKKAFLNCLLESPETAINIIRSLTTRLRDATEGSRSLALDNVYRRLADKLYELAGVDRNEAFSDPSTEPNLAKKYSHQELGNMIGASREMVGKVMAELVKGEYVEVREGRLYLLKKLPHNW